jgi:hypothetical protein
MLRDKIFMVLCSASRYDGISAAKPLSMQSMKQIYLNRNPRMQSLVGLFLGCTALLMIFLAAGSASASVLAQGTTEPTEAVEAPVQTAGETGRVLVWVGRGSSAENKTSGVASELGYLDPRGVWQKLMDLPATFAGVYPCGDRALSPDGRRFTFIVHQLSGGIDGGMLYQITDAGQPVQIGMAHALTCIGGDPFQYSADSQHLAYINFTYNQNRIDVNGTLRVVNADTLAALGEYASAASFYLTSDDLFYTGHYNNASGTVDEIAVMRASISASDTTASEIATLFVSPGCSFTSSQITAVFGRLAVLVGETCGSNRQWQLYTLNRDGGALQSLGTVTGAATFYTNARTNRLVSSWNDRYLLFAVPDGSLRYTVGISSLSLETPALDNRTALVSGQVQFPTYSNNRLPGTGTAFPRFSPDGRYWAMVEVSRAASTLYVIDRAQPTQVSELISSPAAVSQLFFSPDSQSLYAVVGGLNGTANRLHRWDLQTLSDDSGDAAATAEPAGEPAAIVGTMVAEGTFGNTVIYPDGRAAAAVIWRRGTDRSQTAYQTLARISLEDGTLIQQLLTDASMIEINPETNNVIRQRFVYPLVALEASPSTPQPTPAAP